MGSIERNGDAAQRLPRPCCAPHTAAAACFHRRPSVRQQRATAAGIGGGDFIKADIYVGHKASR